MAVYAWKGLTNAGKAAKGVVHGDSPKAVRTQLRRDGIHVTELTEGGATATRSRLEVNLKAFTARVSPIELALATRQLSTLLRSGVPLVSGLEALIEQLEKPELKGAYSAARDKVNEGATFASALKDHPKVFAPLYVHMVEAGEASGSLEVVLARLADFLEAQSRLRSRVISAMAYPALMGILGLVVIFVMMTVVVPKVTAIFADFDQALPWYTRLLIAISTVFSAYWWLLLIMIAGGIWWFRRWVRTEAGRVKWDQLTLRAPIFGNLTIMIAVARFARTLATLLRSGVPLLRALEITRNILGNRELMEIIERATTAIREGESIAGPLRRSGRFPPIVVHMIAIGEKSGELETMLEHVAGAYEHQIDARLTALTSLLEPIMILVMGGMAGSIAFAILMPLLRINEFIQ